MELLILKGFNNYFNRKIKKYSSLQDYKDNSDSYLTFGSINFNPNNGVATSQVIGSENQKDGGNILDWETTGAPDYLIAYETEVVQPDPEDEEGEVTYVNHIRHRWFVLESVRTRAGQYQLALKRDIIADHLEQILTNPCFVEKGYVQPTSPLIFNDEGVSFNEVKKSETRLYDETGCPWIVMYIARNAPNGADKPIEGKMILDNSNVLAESDLPWYNVLHGTPNENKTYIVRGAAQIIVKPIVVNTEIDADNHYCYWPYRTILPYNPSNDNNTTWKLASSARTERIGKKNNEIDATADDYYVLTRGDINLTPAKGRVRAGDDGKIVPAFVTPPVYNDWNWKAKEIARDQCLSDSLILCQQTGVYSNAQKTSLDSWLTNSANVIKALTAHSTINNIDVYAGGNQVFKSAASILSYNNKVVKIGTSYYRLVVTQGQYGQGAINAFGLDANNDIINTSTIPGILATNDLKSFLARVDAQSVGTNSGNLNIQDQRNNFNEMTETDLAYWQFSIKYERISGDLLRCTIPQPSDRNQTNDAVYDILAFPYGSVPYVVPADGNASDLPVANSSKESSIGMARAIAAELGSGCYDVQMMPYCPFRQAVERFADEGYFNLGITSTLDQAPYAWMGIYKIAQSGDAPSRDNRRGFALWCPSCQDTFDLTYQIDIPEADSIEYKLYNSCKKFRLVAPNYSSSFEFMPLKNLGVSTFNIDFTYKPYNSFVHISPLFNSQGLYGVDTDDARGLILQGDFSVAHYSDAWADYQIQNANYANIFNRQLQNIDVTQGIEREKTWTSNVTNIVSESLGLGGGLQGARAGSVGGPWGALIGGAAGTTGGIVGSAVGSYYDWKWLNEAQKEERSYAVDMYNLNLGNVKALPYGMAKSDALNTIFKEVPFIEEWDCTEVEKEIYRNKLNYDGMAVNAIGSLSDYINPEAVNYQRLKGRMIFIDNITDDFQIANAIYTEVDKGFYYIPQGE